MKLAQAKVGTRVRDRSNTDTGTIVAMTGHRGMVEVDWDVAGARYTEVAEDLVLLGTVPSSSPTVPSVPSSSPAWRPSTAERAAIVAGIVNADASDEDTVNDVEQDQLDQLALARIFSEERAAEAIHGGRYLTGAIARMLDRYPGHRAALAGEEGAERLAATWSYYLQPSGDPGASGLAAFHASRGGPADRSLRVFRTLQQAEAMVEWPIYRAALTAQKGA